MNAELFRGTVRKYIELRHIGGVTKLRLHTSVGSPNTWKKYWDDPQLMPIKILEEIRDSLNVPREEYFEILK